MFHIYDQWGWYAGSSVAPVARSTEVEPMSYSTSDVPGAQRSNWTGYAWAQMAYQPPPVPVRSRKLTGHAFKMRMTPEERKAIRAAAKVNEDIEDFMDLANSAEHIDLDDPVTVLGLQSLEAGGLLAQGRAAEILTPDATPNEEPTQ